MDINLKELEKQFHADGYRMGMTAAEGGISKETLFAAVENLHQMVDELVEFFSEFAGRNNQKPA